MSEKMDRQSGKQPEPARSPGTNWGPWLFLLALGGVLGFFYWLTIYAGGVGH